MHADSGVAASPHASPIDSRAERCRICLEPEPLVIELREMLFGTREPFEYLHCRSCGAIQIRAIPDDLGRHDLRRRPATVPGDHAG
ncbi:MAG: hypothetical protein HYX57_04155 [Chloroflexi bacterium]|nr:hypothetical protein [Chloroflexota bacterium]